MRTVVNFHLNLIISFVFFSAVGNGAPQIPGVSRQIPAAARRTLFSEPTKDVPGPEKNYTGIRVRDDSKLVIYYHEQTIAVVEVGNRRELFNCELLEVKTKPDRKAALKLLKPTIPNHVAISFPNMKNLMEQCQKLDPPKNIDKRYINDKVTGQQDVNTSERGLSSLFSGVFPGTKWCGTGDIAGSYFDLGNERKLDKCCRTHDLCPVKVSGLKTQYNITNYSLYTKSHCMCDEKFYSCLKSIKSSLSDFLGNIYFNLAQVTCVEDVPSPENPKVTKKTFKTLDKRY